MDELIRETLELCRAAPDADLSEKSSLMVRLAALNVTLTYEASKLSADAESRASLLKGKKASLYASLKGTTHNGRRRSEKDISSEIDSSLAQEVKEVEELKANAETLRQLYFAVAGLIKALQVAISNESRADSTYSRLS